MGRKANSLYLCSGDTPVQSGCLDSSNKPALSLWAVSSLRGRLVPLSIMMRLVLLAGNKWLGGHVIRGLTKVDWVLNLDLLPSCVF